MYSMIGMSGEWLDSMNIFREVLDITFLLIFQGKNVFFISSKIFEIFRVISINLTVQIYSKSNVNKIGPFVATKALIFYGPHVRQ